jgi:hypothetical protein
MGKGSGTQARQALQVEAGLNDCGEGLKPILFLDVDGVLNCPGPMQDKYDCSSAHGAEVAIPPGMMEKVKALSALYEPVWATAWFNDANSYWNQVFELESDWPVLEYNDKKLPMILEYAKGRSWAWVDDDALKECQELGIDPQQLSGLILVPSFNIGLSDEHVMALIAHAKADS